MGRVITTLIVLALIVAGGIWMFNRGDNDVAFENNEAVQDYTGTGGPADDYDPLEDRDGDGDVDEDDANFESKG